MARRSRSIDHAYRHTLTVRPLTPDYWQGDVITEETRAAAAPEPEPLSQIIVEAVQEGLEPEPYEPTPPEPEPPKRIRKPKPPAPPSPWRLVFSDDGEMIGFRHTETNEFDAFKERQQQTK